MDGGKRSLEEWTFSEEKAVADTNSDSTIFALNGESGEEKDDGDVVYAFMYVLLCC